MALIVAKLFRMLILPPGNPVDGIPTVALAPAFSWFCIIVPSCIDDKATPPFAVVEIQELFVRFYVYVNNLKLNIMQKVPVHNEINI